MLEQQSHLHRNPVSADGAQHFERFVLQARRPNLMGRWRILKPAQRQPADVLLTYAFLFDSSDTEEDCELSNLLLQHLPEKEAEQLIQSWDDMLIPYRRWMATMGEPVDDITQPGWTFTTCDQAQ